MIDQGKIISSSGELARIEFERGAACASCGACHIQAGGKAQIEGLNSIGARVGDQVEVEISPAAARLTPLIAYGIPIALFFFGIVLGNIFSELISILLGFLFLAIGLAAAKAIDFIFSRHKKFIGRITRVLKEAI